MKSKIKTYSSSEIDVHYDIPRCFHARECVHGLPNVFDPDRQPWIDPTQRTADEIAEVVLRCPAGALKYERKDGGAAETAPETNTVTVAPDGPLYLRGAIELVAADGALVLKDMRLALCRCGASKNKPLCDAAHEGVGFSDPAVLGELKKKVEATASGALRVRLAENGPLLLEGPVEILGAGSRPETTGKAALCRCGESKNKPYCDGSHKTIGFRS